MIKYVVFRTTKSNFIVVKVDTELTSQGTYRLKFKRSDMPPSYNGYIPYSANAAQVFDTFSEAADYANSQAQSVKETLIRKIKYQIEDKMKLLAKAESHTPKVTKRINLVK